MAFNGKRRRPKPVAEPSERRRDSSRRVRSAELRVQESAEELRRWQTGQVDFFPDDDDFEDEFLPFGKRDRAVG